MAYDHLRHDQKALYGQFTLITSLSYGIYVLDASLIALFDSHCCEELAQSLRKHNQQPQETYQVTFIDGRYDVVDHCRCCSLPQNYTHLALDQLIPGFQKLQGLFTTIPQSKMNFLQLFRPPKKYQTLSNRATHLPQFHIRILRIGLFADFDPIRCPRHVTVAPLHILVLVLAPDHRHPFRFLTLGLRGWLLSLL